MAVDLNGKIDIDQYTLKWLNMGDDRVCPDCERLAAMPPASYEVWITERTEPLAGDTVCRDKCRCCLVPDDLILMSADLLKGGKIIIADIGKLVVGREVSYELFERLDDLMTEYLQAAKGAKLPQAFYDIESVEGRIRYLEDWLKANR